MIQITRSSRAVRSGLVTLAHNALGYTQIDPALFALRKEPGHSVAP